MEQRWLRSTVEPTLRWHTVTLELDGWLDRCRLFLPFFELSGGNSLAFIALTPEGQEPEARELLHGYAWHGGGEVRVGWAGISAESRRVIGGTPAEISALRNVF